MVNQKNNELIHTEIITITPTLAQSYLKRNKETNRKISQLWVDYFSREIIEGRWQLTHQGIALSADGTLLDGQHRLSAIIKADRAVPMQVNYYPSSSNNQEYNAFDQIRTRNIGTILNVRKPVVSMLSRMIDVFLLGGQKVSPHDVNQLFRSPLGRYADELIKYSATERRFYTCAMVKAAAVIAIVGGEDKAYVFALYRKIATAQELSSLPPIGSAFISYGINERMNLRSHKPSYMQFLYGKARLTFTEKLQNRKGLTISALQQQSFILEAKTVINKYLK